MDIKTLPEEFEEIKPQKSGFRFFVVFCCVVLLGLGGLGLHNWLKTGDPLGIACDENGVTQRERDRVKEAIDRYLESSPDKVDLSKSPKLESKVVEQNTNKILMMTRDGVTIEAEISYLGDLSLEAQEELCNLVANMLYKDVPKNQKILLEWSNKYDIISMQLRSSKPLAK